MPKKAEDLPPIGRNSSITIGLLLSVMGGVIWLTIMFAQGQANAETGRQNKKQIDKMQDTQAKILKLINNQQLMMQENHLNIEYIKKSVEKIEKKVGE